MVARKKVALTGLALSMQLVAENSAPESEFRKQPEVGDRVCRTAQSAYGMGNYYHNSDIGLVIAGDLEGLDPERFVLVDWGSFVCPVAIAGIMITLA